MAAITNVIGLVNIPITTAIAPKAIFIAANTVKQTPSTFNILVIVSWCSFTHSPITFNTSANPFSISTITPPVQLAIGCKKLSHSHFPASMKASNIGFKTSKAPESRLKKAGNKSDIVHSASGANISSKSHFKIFPILSSIGFIELHKSSHTPCILSLNSSLLA